MMRYVWLTLLTTGLAVFTAFEVPALANKVPGDTLSEVLRWLFHTSSLTGRIVWLTLWCGFAAWFAIHIAWKNSI